MNANALVYQRVFLRGRILRRVSSIDLTTSILGQQFSLPIYTSPVGLGKLVHPDGKCAIAAADGKEGIIQVVNTVNDPGFARKELQTNMAYLGTRKLAELRPEMINTKPLEKMLVSSPSLQKR